MSASITLVGRLGADPDLKFSAKGSAVGKFRVVTNGRRQVDGKWEDVDVSWWQVTAFGQVAESAMEGLSKGSAVIIQGKAKQDTWTDKEGNERTSIVVIADSIGIDLRWSSAPRSVERLKASEPVDDPWTSQSPAAPF
jgi:single-strand DNA-binding protein